MNKAFKVALVTAPLLLAAALQASAWDRSSTVSGASGRTATTHSSGSCSGNTCSRNTSVTGPNGGVSTRLRTVTCANGVCNSNANVTGAHGRGWTRKSAISR